ncbi:MAG: hypothetical protein ACFFAH_17440 [Promethearchaeota archaeon]
MAKTHNYSFFGQNTGLLINNPSDKELFFFIRSIKRKPDGSWEKPSNGEGKVIKISLDETVMILEVLNHNTLNWTSYHTFKDDKTQISFGWEDKSTKTLWIKIANYSKMLNFAQAEILRRLLEHFLNEKIKNATIMNNNGKSDQEQLKDVSHNSQKSKNSNQEDVCQINLGESQYEQNLDNGTNDKNLMNEISQLNGIIQGETEKALLINFNSGQEIWVPKSTIHGKYTPRKNLEQEFLIDDWILKRNKIIS